MDTLQFKIDEQHLAYQQWLKCFASSAEAPQEWQDLHSELEEKHGKDIAFTMFSPGDAAWAFNPIGLDGHGVVRLKNPERVLQIFGDIKASNAFQQLLSETVEYKNTVENKWQKHGDQAVQFFKDITGLPIGDRSFTVYTLHPSINNGSYVDNNEIEWGSPEPWKNGTVVGLCHEMLHGYTADRASNLMHALIFLASHEELRCRLNDVSEYFVQDGLQTSPPSVVEEMRRVLPRWRQYLAEKDESQQTIIDLYDVLAQELPRG